MIQFTVPLASAIPHGDDNTPISATVTSQSASAERATR